MTYKEFERKIKELDEGLEFGPIGRKGDFNEVRYVGKHILYISDKCPYEIDTMVFNFTELFENKSYAEELFDLCVELAKTPIDERVEEQKYYVEFADGFMLYRDLKSKIYRRGIDCPDKDILDEFGECCYTFTEAEIKAIDERYWAFAVPAEEEN